MDLVKKNLVNLICGAVVLLAVAAYFWPLGSQEAALQAKAAQQVGVYKNLESLLTQPRKLPVISIDDQTQGDLHDFPNPSIISAAKEARARLQSESQKMLSGAIQLNKHELLVPHSLPDPQNEAFDFRDKYFQLVVPQAGRRLSRLVTETMRGDTPPTPEEIALETKAAEPRAGRVPAAPRDAGQRQEEEAQAAALPDMVRQRRAKQCMMYVNPDALEISAAITGQNTGKPKAPDIWQAQFMLWIQQDVCQALAAANKNASCVLDAPVKHLVKLVVRPTFVTGAAPGGAMGGAPAGEGGAAAPSTDPNAPLPKVPAVSATGRVSNALFDVAQFRLQVNVEAAKIPLLIQELERGRFITVTQVDVASVDSDVMAAAGYVYGTQRVAEVTLSCEALLFREWTVPLMPLAVQQFYGCAPPPPAQPG